MGATDGHYGGPEMFSGAGLGGAQHGIPRAHDHPWPGWDAGRSRSRTSAPGRRHDRANLRLRGTCCACGGRRCNRANGARSACSRLTMTPSSRPRSPRCPCARGGPTRSHPSRPTPTTRPGSWPRRGTCGGCGALPGQGRALGLWRARDLAGMQAVLVSLPLSAWVSVETTPLTAHPATPPLPMADHVGVDAGVGHRDRARQHPCFRRTKGNAGRIGPATQRARRELSTDTYFHPTINVGRAMSWRARSSAPSTGRPTPVPGTTATLSYPTSSGCTPAAFPSTSICPDVTQMGPPTP
jgi:muconolactone delta-isomerase